MGAFLFLGPTGVGKTELAKQLAKVYFGGEQNIISVTPLTYTHLDIGSQKLMSEYAVLIVYRG